MSEALVRVRAELTAAGFSVDPQQCEKVPTELGSIDLMLHESRLEIIARSVTSGSTMTQFVDLTQSNVTAEVVAVRAVESFRAVLLHSLRSGELGEDRLTDAMRHFTQFPESQGTDEQSQPIQPDREQPTKAKARSSSDERKSDGKLQAVLFVGPSLESSPGASAWLLGGEARGVVHFHGASLGVVAEVNASPFNMTLGSDDARASAWGVLLRPGVRLVCGIRWECHLGMLAGIHQVNFIVTNSMTERQSARHQSWLLQGDAMIGRFFDSGLGVMATFRGGALLNAPVFVSTGSDARIEWGRPLLDLSIGLGYRL